MKVYYVRHGQTDWNAQLKIQGSTDNPLNDIGIKQAYETKKKLENVDYNLVICSPKIRARQTAEIITQGRNVEIIYDDRIIERTFGESEGANITDKFEKEIWDYTLNRKFKGGESFKEFEKRILEFLEDIKEKYKDRTILIVAHGGVSVIINMYLKGCSENNIMDNYVIKNCEILEFEL